MALTLFLFPFLSEISGRIAGVTERNGHPASLSSCHPLCSAPKAVWGTAPPSLSAFGVLRGATEPSQVQGGHLTLVWLIRVVPPPGYSDWIGKEQVSQSWPMSLNSETLVGTTGEAKFSVSEGHW